MNDGIFKFAKKTSLLGGAALVVLTLVGLLNKYLIADPIARAMAEERMSRETGDRLIVEKLSQIRVGQGQVLEAVTEATYSRDEINRMRDASSQDRAGLHQLYFEIERRVSAIEQRRR